MKRILTLVVVSMFIASISTAERDINGVRVLTEIEEFVDPASCAVLVIDMQNEIVSSEGRCQRTDRDAEPDPSRHEVVEHYRDQVANIQKLLDRSREIGIPVFYAEYVHQGDNGEMIVSGSEYWTHRHADWVSCAVEGTWGAQTIDELTPHEGDHVIRKARANSFHNTYLDDFLKEENVQTLLLAGTAGAGCVLATGMGGLDRGYYGVIVKDCVDQHEYIENPIISGRFPIYTLGEIFDVWKDAPGNGERANTKTANED